MSDHPVVRPITEMTRVQEHGRIRFGVKGPRYPKALDTFRFTSPDERAIRQLAELYGGTPQQWSDRSARIQNQWEVITETNTIEVWVPPDAVSAGYEAWTAAGCQRRCDGTTCKLLDMDEPQPCLCWAQQKRACKPKTRFNVVIPDIDFGGVWRGESGSWDALEEMQTMMQMIDAMEKRTPFLICTLILQDMKKTKNGETHRWKYPKLIPQDSMKNIVLGDTAFTALQAGANGTVHTVRELNPHADPLAIVEIVDDEDVELVEEGKIVELEPQPEVWPRLKDAMLANPGSTSKDFKKTETGKWVRS